MILTQNELNKWAESTVTFITAEQNKIILERFGSEPEAYEWSEQDIYVQIRNYLRCGHWEKPSVRYGHDEKLLQGVEF